jgi:hypothetical protein
MTNPEVVRLAALALSQLIVGGFASWFALQVIWRPTSRPVRLAWATAWVLAWFPMLLATGTWVALRWPARTIERVKAARLEHRLQGMPEARRLR